MLKNQLLEAKNTLGLTFLDLIEKDKVNYMQSLLDNYTIPAKIADESIIMVEIVTSIMVEIVTRDGRNCYKYGNLPYTGSELSLLTRSSSSSEE